MPDHKDADQVLSERERGLHAEPLAEPHDAPPPLPLPSPGDRTAWDSPATRWAWRWHTVRTGLALVAWVAVWFALYALTQTVFPLASVVFVPYTFYAAYRLLMLLAGALPDVFRMRRTLRGHPWQLIENAEHGLSAHPAAASDKPWIAVPDPTAPGDPDARLPLLLFAHPRTRWWTRRMRSGAGAQQRAEIGVLWLCGDPRADVVIAAPPSAAARPGARTAPRRLLHLRQRNALIADRQHGTPAAPLTADPVVSDPSRPALSHPSTSRTMRGRMHRRVLLFAVVWPALLVTQVALVVRDDRDLVGLFVIIVLLQLTLLPLHVVVLVSTRRMTALLATHPWRPVDCVIRSRGRAQLVTVGDQVLTPSPWRVYLDQHATHLWIAGDPRARCMASAPGGARPVSLGPGD
ncbi:hypothetical protein [Streptomyces sp. NPDC051214]|uniref:hypothetical protein n=1 Tax=Streptomyces sp. NPDC051214 TaxID=3155282 RepID=UPI0034211289